MAEPAVRFDAVSKRFPGALALSGVSLTVAAGSCHALCGENGAGKSTLGKLLAGIHRPDAGRLFVEGREVRFATPRDALAAGVGMVHQELAGCPNLSVAENLCLGALPARRGMVDRPALRRRAAALLAELGTPLELDRPLGELPLAARQLVQIAQAVGQGARIIVFDEPTSSLSQREAEALYALIGRLLRRGVTCLYVSHRMAEVFRLCDIVSVLRDGRHVATRLTRDVSEAELIQLMIGRPLAEYLPRPAGHAPGETLLRAEQLSVPGSLESVSFSLRAGEVVGLAGLVGAGRSELAEALFGLRRVASGRIWIAGKRVAVRTPRQAVRGGLGLVPEDRQRQGIVPGASWVHNLSLGVLPRLARLGWIDRGRERSLAAEFRSRLRIAVPRDDAPAATLSGGNQQKLLLARWLAARSRILLLDEPTRGVDIAAKAEIHALIGALASQGAAILLSSSELPELLSLSDRILVLRTGRLVGEVPRERATQDGLLRMMSSR
jgi:ribose transport system ATP-binding protein